MRKRLYGTSWPNMRTRRRLDWAGPGGEIDPALDRKGETMFWVIDLDSGGKYATEGEARKAAQAIANREYRPVIVAMGLPGAGYTELAFTVRPE